MGSETTIGPTIYRGPQYLIPQLYILGGIEFLICLCCLCYSLYVYKTYISTKREKINKSLKYMNFCGMLSFLFCSISQSINIYYWNSFYWTFSTTQTITWYLTWFWWSLGIFMSYLLFLNRIKTTFKNSIYEPKHKTMIYLYILLTMYAIIWIFAAFIPYTIYIFNVDRDIIFEIEFILSIPITLIDILITASMTFIFVSRIYKLILLQTKTTFNEELQNVRDFARTSNSPSSHVRVTLLITNQHRVLMTVSVKIALLAITSLVSSLILITLRAISFFMSYKSVIAKCAAMWIQFDTIISCLCLVLFLPKTQRAFSILCCCCNALSKKCMERYVKNSTVQTP